MATFEDNNPFASPGSPTPSRADSYTPFGAAGGGGYPYSPTTTATGTASQSHQPHPSFDVPVHRPNTSSSDDGPGYQYRATNSDFSVDPVRSDSPTAMGRVATTPDEPNMPSQSSSEKEGETCCRVDEVLRRNPEMRIIITDAGKTSDGGANFIAYTIDVGVHTTLSVSIIDVGHDAETAVFGICLVERSARSTIPHINHPAHPRETLHVYCPIPSL
jgi:hypothetical protein